MLGTKGHNVCHADTQGDTQLAGCMTRPPMNKGLPDSPTPMNIFPPARIPWTCPRPWRVSAHPSTESSQRPHLASTYHQERRERKSWESASCWALSVSANSDFWLGPRTLAGFSFWLQALLTDWNPRLKSCYMTLGSRFPSLPWWLQVLAPAMAWKCLP